MKSLYKLFALTALVAVLGSCGDPEDLMTGDAVEGGIVNPVKASLNYVVGNNATYTVQMQVEQGPSKTTSVEVYRSFFSNTEGWTNETLETTIAITNQATHVVEFSNDYSQLVAGLTFSDGSAIAASDTDLNIGDYWNYRIVSVIDGSKRQSGIQVKLAVSTRFAGTYDDIESVYHRIGVNNGGGWGPVDIESVDASTYRQIGWAFWNDGVNELFFQIDGADNITYPEEWDGVAQTGNGQPLTTCDRNPGDLTNSPCATSNIAIRDDVGGKDQLSMVFGYYTAGSGPREFYQLLQKQI